MSNPVDELLHKHRKFDIGSPAREDLEKLYRAGGRDLETRFVWFLVGVKASERWSIQTHEQVTGIKAEFARVTAKEGSANRIANQMREYLDRECPIAAP